MITIPLADVVAYLTRKGVSLDVLEGAPCVRLYGGDPDLLQTMDGYIPDDHTRAALYLGTDKVCPAAMGWASTLLATSRPAAYVGLSICVDDDSVRAAVWINPNPFHTWRWADAGATVEVDKRNTLMGGPTPSSAAARLQAVLLYEMGRA